jgi:DNA (cytosine-5)-methyltransferase 1
MNELALFAGAGGGILGGHLLGWRTVCAVEWEQYPASVLCARQNDGLLPPFPIWDDVQTFDGKPWRGIVDVVSGGFPCQDISAAGKGAGIDGERSGMWGEMARIIHEVRPRYVFVENSPMLTSRGLGRVLGDLASMGFDARWGVLGAADVGANHQRGRIWIVAKWRGQLPHAEHDRIGWWEQQQEGIKEKNGFSNSNSNGLQEQEQFVRVEQKNNNFSNNGSSQCLANANGIASKVGGNDFANEAIGGKRDNDHRRSRSNDWGKPDAEKNEQLANTCEIRPCSKEAQQRMAREFRFAECGVDRDWWQREPDYVPRTTERNMGGVANGVASRVDRLKAIGNGQVPLCAATAWRILSQ